MEKLKTILETLKAGLHLAFVQDLHATFASPPRAQGLGFSASWLLQGSPHRHIKTSSIVHPALGSGATHKAWQSYKIKGSQGKSQSQIKKSTESTLESKASTEPPKQSAQAGPFTMLFSNDLISPLRSIASCWHNMYVGDIDTVLIK